jgi:hypothetical protein
VSDQGGAERREFVRVDCDLRFSMAPLRDEQQVEEAVSKIAFEPLDARVEAMEVDPDSDQAIVLQAISQLMSTVEELTRKVDRLVEKMEREGGEEVENIRLPLRNISGGGFHYYTHQPPNAGDLFEVAIEISQFPAITARCVVVVKWVRPLAEPMPPQAPGAPPATHQVGMEINHIREVDRDRIIRAVFRAQREQLRARKADK